MWLRPHILQAAQTVFSRIHLRRKRVTEAASLLPFFRVSPSFVQTCFFVEHWIKETPGPIAVPNLSSHPEREVCYVCVRTLKSALSLTAAGALHFIPPASKWSTPISKAFAVETSRLEFRLLGAAFVINRSVQHMFYANARCIPCDTATCECFIRKRDVHKHVMDAFSWGSGEDRNKATTRWRWAFYIQSKQQLPCSFSFPPHTSLVLLYHGPSK